MEKYIDSIKAEIINTETKSIKKRNEVIECILFKLLDTYNTKWKLKSFHHNSTPFHIIFDSKKLFEFIYNWNGVKFKQDTSKTLTREICLKKSENWVNGKKASVFGNILFVDYIKQCENYIGFVAHEFCINKPNKLTSFFCKNSVIKNTKLKKLLQDIVYQQNMGFNDLNIKGFPVTMSHAIEVYKKLSIKSINMFEQEYNNINGIRNIQYISNNNNVVNHNSNNILEYYIKRCEILEKQVIKLQNENNSLKNMVKKLNPFNNEMFSNFNNNNLNGFMLVESEIESDNDNDNNNDNNSSYYYHNNNGNYNHNNNNNDNNNNNNYIDISNFKHSVFF